MTWSEIITVACSTIACAIMFWIVQRVWFRKKFYREVVCKFCHGQGQHLFNMTPEGLGRYLGSKLCKACNGKGTQTVLERVE